MTSALHEQHCVACEGGIAALNDEQIAQHQRALAAHWKLLESKPTTLCAQFQFRDYYQTTAFVNALAWIAHRENHHPDISFGYRDCTVNYTTHAALGLTLNDFICAAKIDALLSRDANHETSL